MRHVATKQAIERCLVRMRFPAFRGREPIHERVRKPAKEFVFVPPDAGLPSRRQIRAIFGPADAPKAADGDAAAPPPEQGPPEQLDTSVASAAAVGVMSPTTD
jgi:hypothetical protein